VLQVCAPTADRCVSVAAVKSLIRDMHIAIWAPWEWDTPFLKNADGVSWMEAVEVAAEAGPSAGTAMAARDRAGPDINCVGETNLIIRGWGVGIKQVRLERGLVDAMHPPKMVFRRAP
jgi:hypothetical protein